MYYCGEAVNLNQIPGMQIPHPFQWTIVSNYELQYTYDVYSLRHLHIHIQLRHQCEFYAIY